MPLVIVFDIDIEIKQGGLRQFSDVASHYAMRRVWRVFLLLVILCPSFVTRSVQEARLPFLRVMMKAVIEAAINAAANEAITIHSHRGRFAIQDGASVSSSTATVKAKTGLGSLMNGSVAFTCQK